YRPLALGASIPIPSVSDKQAYISFIVNNAFVAEEIEKTSINYGVTTNRIGNGETGYAITQGVAVCFVDIQDAGHEYARPEADKFISCAGKSTIKILAQEAGTGDTLCRVHLGIPVYTTFGKSITQIEPDIETAVEVWIDGVDQQIFETVVMDWLSVEPISAGKEIAFVFVPDEGIFRVIAAECEDPEPFSFGSSSVISLVGATVPATFANFGVYDSFTNQGRAGGDADGVGLDNTGGPASQWRLDAVLTWIST
ncbi:unnamed protein product, partial [marine sediment metagenome]